MALVKSTLLQGLSGKFGNMVFKQRRGKTYVEKMPVYNKNRIPTKDELLVRSKFSKSVAYAQKAMADPKLKEIYRRGSNRKKTPYSNAFRHATKNPHVRRIMVDKYTGKQRSKIFIMVMDDVRVEEVMVSIVTADGVLVEQGKAYLPKGKIYDWTYVATKDNKELEGCRIIAVAKNLPENEGMLETIFYLNKSSITTIARTRPV